VAPTFEPTSNRCGVEGTSFCIDRRIPPSLHFEALAYSSVPFDAHFALRCVLWISACVRPLISCPTYRHSQHESSCSIQLPIDPCDSCLQDHLSSYSRTFSTKNRTRKRQPIYKNIQCVTVDKAFVQRSVGNDCLSAWPYNDNGSTIFLLAY
jgi:hypothetical protein